MRFGQLLEEQVASKWEGTNLDNSRNYGPTLSLGNKSVNKGHHQVLWLFEDLVIEAGTSNLFFVFKAPNDKVEIVTPKLHDLILPGVTRDSIIVTICVILEVS